MGCIDDGDVEMNRERLHHLCKGAYQYRARTHRHMTIDEHYRKLDDVGKDGKGELGVLQATKHSLRSCLIR